MAAATTTTLGEIVLAGDLTGEAQAPELVATGVIPGTYAPVQNLVVDSKGRVITAGALTFAEIEASVAPASAVAKGIVQIGNGISVSCGEISIPDASPSTKGIASIGTGLNVSSGTVSLNDDTITTASTTNRGVVITGENIQNDTGLISILNAGTSSSGVVQLDQGFVASGGVLTAPQATQVLKGVIQPGANIEFSGNTISINTGSASTKGLVQIGSNIDVSGGVISLQLAGANHGVAQIGDNISVAAGVISVPDASAITAGVFKLGAGLKSTGAFIQDADAGQLGVVNLGQGFTDAGGLLSASVATTTQKGVARPGTNLSINSGVLSINTATDSSVGVVRIGAGLSVSAGVVSRNDSGTTDATGSSKGIVQIGSNVAVSSGVVSVPIATTSTAGVVSIDSASLAVTDGVISIPPATDTTPGAVSAGDFISVDGAGTISFGLDPATETEIGFVRTDETSFSHKYQDWPPTYVGMKARVANSSDAYDTSFIDLLSEDIFGGDELTNSICPSRVYFDTGNNRFVYLRVFFNGTTYVSSIKMVNPSTRVVTTHSTPYNTRHWLLSFSGSSFLLVDGETGATYSSSDAESWASGAAVSLPSSGQWHGLVYAAGYFVIWQQSTEPAYRTTNGSSWSSVGTRPSLTFGRILAANDVLFSGSSKICRSTDGGATWSSASLEDTTLGEMLTMTFMNGRYVAVAVSGNYMFSDDGTNWTYKTGSSTSRFVFNDGNRFIWGNYASVDADNWYLVSNGVWYGAGAGIIIGDPSATGSQMISIAGAFDDAEVSLLGLVQAGDNISISSGFLSIPDATTSSKGKVQIGDNIAVSGDVISIPDASTAAFGVFRSDNTTLQISGPFDNKTVSLVSELRRAEFTDVHLASYAEGVTVLTPSSNIDVQWGGTGGETSHIQTLATNQNFTLTKTANAIFDRHIFLFVTQDGTGSRTMTLDTAAGFRAVGDTTLSTTPGKVDLVIIIPHAINFGGPEVGVKVIKDFS